MKTKRMPLCAPLRDLTLTDADRKAQTKEDLVWMFQQMLLIRAFEEKVVELKDKDLINGPVHTSVGQEAVAVGAAMAVGLEDKFCGTHRAHHQYLAKALNACVPPGYDPLRDGLTDRMQGHTLILLKEIMGLAEGCSGGRGGSMHLCNRAIGLAGTNAIVGGGLPAATGVAWSDKFQGRDCVTICFYGDGAVYQGAVHEACNLASLWKAPIIYVIENNQYAVATSRAQSCSAPSLCQVAAAYGMPGFRTDGMDPLAVRSAIERILRKRELPCVLELNTYRHYHHAGSAPGSASGYRSKEEEAQWRERDPLARFEQELRERRVSGADIEKLQTQARDCVEAAVAACLKTDAAGTAVIRDELWPAAATAIDGLRDDSVASTGPFVEQDQVPCAREVRYSDAIAEVTGRWLERDPAVVALGEEVANMGGGAYGATKGLAELFPERVRNTPITEAGFCGLACGAAMNGMRPIVELMFSSFALVAADQLFNQIGQLGHIYGARVSVPLVCRTRVAIGLGYGAQHSMDPVALFTLFPGWRIFVPTTPFDYIGLFNAAMKLESPTLIVEHHGFYTQKGRVPEGPPDHVVAPGAARVRRDGADATVLAYGWGVELAMKAAEQLEDEGLSAEVIDLRTVDDASIDHDTIGNSLRKTGVLVTVEQAPRCNSIGAKLARECMRRWFDYLDAPVVCVNASDIPLPVSRRLELLCLPTVDEVVETVRNSIMRRV